MLEKSVSYMEKYGIGKSTVSDIKKNKAKIIDFSHEVVDMGMKNRPR